MYKRDTQSRRQAIVDLLEVQGQVDVDELVAKFGTSAVTIRKDLSELESQSLLVRRFGGAVKASPAKPDETNTQDNPFKLALSRLAAGLVKDSSRIVIDSGSTTSSLIPHLADKSNLVVMTNSLQVAQTLLAQESGHKLLMTGGTWDAQSSSLQGNLAQQMLKAYSFDQAFVGAAGLDLQLGTKTYNELTSLSQTMAQVSDQVIVLAESTKLQHRIPNVELPWSDVTTLVTDERISVEAKQMIEAHGVTVLCATLNGD
ncbi:DeoR/GlpR family DNA-binding transcription regulator [Aestuariibacter salexigens]|uniref:DeoR/GlpR family DNA-binding transcription regulator n=1 Tax=Aestuariibacter salexigens TaxID=226010 RepID=UPI000404FF2F|nr:DeoR/GlpR family DNA-binding transcription regulator [Aestuariibacter salexigens]